MMHKDLDDTIYTALIVSLVLGIIISIGFIYLTEEKPAPFTELFFINHQDLPNEVEMKSDYNFSYAVVSHEGTLEDYMVVSELELFNIYDLSGGSFECFKKYRGKIYLTWLPSNATNHSILRVNDLNDTLFSDFYTLQDLSYSDKSIQGDSYDISFEYKPSYGMGELAALVRNGSSLSYALIISEKTGKAYFTYQNGSLIQVLGKQAYFSENGHTISISAKDRMVNVYIDGNLTFSQEVSSSKGSLSFETNSGYYSVSKAIIIEGEQITDIVIDGNTLSRYAGYVRDMKSDGIPVNIKGEYEPLKYNTTFNYYLNLTGLGEKALMGREPSIIDIRSTLLTVDTSIYSLIYRWANLSFEPSSFPSYYYETEDIGKNTINFTNYTIGYTFSPGSGEDQFMLYLYDRINQTKYGFLVSGKYRAAFFLEFRPETVKITLKHLPFLDEIRAVSLNFDNNTLHAYLEDKLLFTINDTENQFSDLSFEARNSYQFINDVYVVSHDIDCSSRRIYEKCSKHYRIIGQKRGVSRYSNVGVTKEEIPGEFPAIDDNSTMPNLTVGGFSPEYLLAPLAAPLLLSQLFGGDEILSEEYNPHINDKLFLLNGPLARMNNMTNYTFEFNYLTLEGIRSVAFGFNDDNNTELLRVMLFDESDKAFLLTKGQNESFKVNLTEDEWHRISLNFDSGRAAIFLDHNIPLFIVNSIQLSDGYFFLSTENTYANFNNVVIRDRTSDTYRRMELEEDPCQLRTIYKETLVSEPLALSPGESRTFAGKFNINQSFDFGLVSAKLINKNQSIHFWIKR